MAELGARVARLTLCAVLVQDIGLSGMTSCEPARIDGLTWLVQQLRSTGPQVLLLGPTPAPRAVVPVCRSGHFDYATACSPPRSAAVNERGVSRPHTRRRLTWYGLSAIRSGANFVETPACPVGFQYGLEGLSQLD